MDDLISRQAALKELPHALWGKEWDEALAKAIIESVPTIDAVTVVRCKDCKHWGMHKRLNMPWCFAMHIDKSEDGYCDFAERKEE